MITIQHYMCIPNFQIGLRQPSFYAKQKLRSRADLTGLIYDIYYATTHFVTRNFKLLGECGVLCIYGLGLRCRSPPNTLAGRKYQIKGIRTVAPTEHLKQYDLAIKNTVRR